MSSQEQMSLDDITADANNLYREEMFTDLKVATVRRLVPVKPDGSDDPTREPMFMGQTQVMSAGGPLPVQAELPGANLEEALAAFPDAIRQAIERMVEEIKEMQRQQSSRIITPGGPGGPGGGGGFGGPCGSGILS